MTNGGWTLIKSRSEKTLLIDGDNTNLDNFNRPLPANARNLVTTPSGVFNEYNFLLPAGVMSKPDASTANPIELRISIKEQGHTLATGRTAADVESTTLPPALDYWSNDNYYNLTVVLGNPTTRAFDPASSTTSSTTGRYSAKGKIFGYALEKNNTNYEGAYTFNGITNLSNPEGFHSDFFTGLYGSVGDMGTASDILTYTYPNSQTFTFNKRALNDLFGYYQSQVQINHHIGACSSNFNNYGGEVSCSGSSTARTAHQFNLIPGTSTYEGRILQVWIK